MHHLAHISCFIASMIVVTACSDVPGDPETLVADGTPVAGYAWTGPGSFCSDVDGTTNVAWHIWFTNTDYCPRSGAEAVGGLVIVSPERVYRPSTKLPEVPSTTVPIRGLYGSCATELAATLGAGPFYGVSGTLTLTTYSTEGVAGSFTAMAEVVPLDDRGLVELHGTFDAKPCARIHD